MKKVIISIMLPILGLSSCITTTTPSPTSSLIPAASSTTILSPIVAYTASPTLTETLTLSPTLSPEQYPNLADVALRYEDIPDDDINYAILENVTIKDISDDMKAQFDCSLDCHGELWSIRNFSVSIMLVKLQSNDHARNLLENTCLEVGKSPYALDLAGFEIVNYEDCIRVVTGELVLDPSPNMWILPISRKEAVLGTTVGAVFLFIRVYHEYPGGDFGGSYLLPLTQFADYQTQKLIKFGIPVNP